VKKKYSGCINFIITNEEGKEKFIFKNGEEVLSWVLRTGASAGFDEMTSWKNRKQLDDRFKNIIEEKYLKEDGITVAHTFVAGIAQK